MVGIETTWKMRWTQAILITEKNKQHKQKQQQFIFKYNNIFRRERAIEKKNRVD
jgi:hypothetical protein